MTIGIKLQKLDSGYWFHVDVGNLLASFNVGFPMSSERMRRTLDAYIAEQDKLEQPVAPKSEENTKSDGGHAYCKRCTHHIHPDTLLCAECAKLPRFEYKWVRDVTYEDLNGLGLIGWELVTLDSNANAVLKREQRF